MSVKLSDRQFAALDQAVAGRLIRIGQRYYARTGGRTMPSMTHGARILAAGGLIHDDGEIALGRRTAVRIAPTAGGMHAHQREIRTRTTAVANDGKEAADQ